MDGSKAIEALAGLAQPTRLKAFRRLLKVYPDAIAAGEIARGLRVPHNTMSVHLSLLVRARLVSVRKDGRSMFYAADVDGFRSLIRFLMRDCCNGRAEICAPLLADLNCCTPDRTREVARG